MACNRGRPSSHRNGNHREFHCVGTP
jgi:hypothetical protein